MRRRGAVVAVVTLVLVGCGDDAAVTATPVDVPLIIDALCDARAAADDGDADRARTTFFDHAHDRLHELASTVSDHDRAVEARLLEAKQAVEADLADDTGDLVVHLEALVTATADAIEATGDTRPQPCTP